MNRQKLWVSQGKYKSIKTGQPMLLVMDKETGETVLEPLYKGRKSEYTKTKQSNWEKVHPLDRI